MHTETMTEHEGQEHAEVQPCIERYECQSLSASCVDVELDL